MLTDFPPMNIEHFFVYIMQKQHFIYVPKYVTEGRRIAPCFVSAQERDASQSGASSSGTLLETMHNCSVMSSSYLPKSRTVGMSTVYIKTRLYEEIPFLVIDAVGLAFSVGGEGNLWLIAPEPMPVIGPAVHAMQLVGLCKRSPRDIFRQLEELTQQVREIHAFVSSPSIPVSPILVPLPSSATPQSFPQSFLFSLPTDS